MADANAKTSSMKVARVASTDSQASRGTIGLGPAEQPTPNPNLPPKLTPEGISLDPTLKVYDAIVYLIYCGEHDKIAVSNVERARCVWFPFVCLTENTKWERASRPGLDLILGKRDIEMVQGPTAEWAKMAPNYTIECLEVMRIQLSTDRVVTRITNLVRLIKSEKSQFKCCQKSPRINWIRAGDILASRIDKIWGGEVALLAKKFRDDTLHERDVLHEKSWQTVSNYCLSDDNKLPEQKLLRQCRLKAEHIAEIYDDYYEHCYPSLFMCFEAFRFYLSKYGWSRDDPRLPFLYKAFAMNGKDHLEFCEVLYGIVAMEPTTKQWEGRLRFIFRYYDTSRNGFLEVAELVTMVEDIMRLEQPNKPLADNDIQARVTEAIRAVGFNAQQQIAEDNFIKAVLLGSGGLKNTDKLCRSPKAILPQISRLIELRHSEKSRSGTSHRSSSRRKERGTCPHCSDQKYEYAMNKVKVNTFGRCVEPRIIGEAWREPTLDGTMNANKFSIEYVFRTQSFANTFVDWIRDFHVKRSDNSPGLMAAQEDWPVFFKCLTMLCEELRGLLLGESKILKINSPALVIGDLQGSLESLIAIEKNFFQTFPVLAPNLIFLGNFSGACSHGIETLLYLFSLKLLAPNKVFLLRGTNEMKTFNSARLRSECAKYGSRYSARVYHVLNDVFARLPFVVIVDENILCVHSGIPRSTKLNTLQQLKPGQDINSVSKESPYAYEMIVNLPEGLDITCQCVVNSGDMEEKSYSRTRREGVMRRPSSIVGVSGFLPSKHCRDSHTFDGNALGSFLQANKLSHLIRSHSIGKPDPPAIGPFDIRFNRKCVTIYSCTHLPKTSEDQTGTEDWGTVALIDGADNQVRVCEFEVRESVKPLNPVVSRIESNC